MKKVTKELLLELFNKDIEFVCNYSIYHPEVAPYIDSVVDDMWYKIKDLDHHVKEYGFFAIDNKDILPWIVGFYVKPEYRKNNNLVQEMALETKDLFAVTISNTNVRAIKLMSKFCKIMQQDDIKTVFYYKRGF